MIKIPALPVIAVALLALFAINGCDKQEESLQDSLNQAKDKAGELRASAEDLASSVGDLGQEKIEKIAQIAAKLENAPAEAMKLIEENGWTREEFDTMVKGIRENETTRAIFDKAKELASANH